MEPAHRVGEVVERDPAMLAEIAKLQAQLGPNAKRRVRAGDVIARQSHMLGLQAAERLETYVGAMHAEEDDDGSAHTMPILRPNVRRSFCPLKLASCGRSSTCVQIPD